LHNLIEQIVSSPTIVNRT